MSDTLRFVFILLIAVSSVSSGIVNVKAVFPKKETKEGDTRLVMNVPLPDLNEVTICHWVSATGSLKTKGSYITSYAHGKAANELATAVVPGANGKVELRMYVRDQEANIVTNQFKLGQWTHLCFSWSSGSGIVTAFVDGQNVGMAQGVQQGESVRSGGVLVLGQDQDVYNGKFDPEEAWEGAIADLQIWDEVMKPEAVLAMGECKIHLEGNVVAWMQSPMRALNGVILSQSHLCKGNVQHGCK